MKLNNKSILTAEKVKHLLTNVYVRFRKGEITEKQAKQETDILSNMLKSIEDTDLQKQYEELKAILKSNQD